MPIFALFASFVLPLVAAGALAAAAGVPLLIHLLSKQRHQVVPWAAMRFLLAAQQKRRKSIDRWLLMALRMLLLFCILLGLCAATPWAERLWQNISPGAMQAISTAPRTHHIFVLDGSLSMTVQKDGTSRFQKAVDMIEKQIAASSNGDGYTLISVAGSTKAIVPGPSNDSSKVLAELRALKPTDGATEYAPALAMVADVLARSPRNYPRRQVTFFTDAQRSAWSGVLPRAESPAAEAWQRILPKADVAVLDCATSDEDNLAIVDLSLVDPLALANAPTAAMVTVQNYGKTDRAQIRVELQLGRPTGNGIERTLVPLETQTIETLPSGQRASVTFPLKDAEKFREAGLHLLQARLLESDALPTDDVRNIVVDVRAALPVLVVNGKAAREPLQRPAAYVNEALDPSGKRFIGNPARPRLVSLAEFADPILTELSSYDCIVLCDVPNLTEAQIARLEAHLKRGGGLIIGLGPTAAENIEWYNRVLFNNGMGLMPGKLLGLKTSAKPNDADYRISAEDTAFRRPPLAIFANDLAHGGITDVPVKSYLQMEAPKGGRAERILSFAPNTPLPKDAPLDPAMVDYTRHRGRIVVFTTSLNTDYTDWPILPSFLPLIHETVRFTTTSPDRHTLRVGESLEELYPVTTVGLTAIITDPEGNSSNFPVLAGDESGVVRYGETQRAGLYRIAMNGRKEQVFAVNVPESNGGGGSESDLHRVDAVKFQDVGAIQVANELADLRFDSTGGAPIVLTPKAHGPRIARWLLSIALALILLELALAWFAGPSRSAAAGVRSIESENNEAQKSRASTLLWSSIAVLFLALAFGMLGIVLHAELTGEWFGFLPDSMRKSIETAAGVPQAGPGEGTRWRIETSRIYFADAHWDRRIIGGIVTFSITLILGIYWFERHGTGKLRRVIVPSLLRLATVLLIVFVMLPQVRLAFEREGWPDVAILLDTSASMATVDELSDVEVRAKAQELAAGTDLGETDRLKLAKFLLMRKGNDWLDRLLTERQVKVHLYSIADQSRSIAELNEPADAKNARDAIAQLVPNGESSRLGDGVQSVLKTFRGGSLAAMIVLTDGITTAGDDLPTAAREAARAGVPLFLVGLGDANDPPDLYLSELKCPDEVLKGDRLEFQLRASVRGPNPPASVPVILYERQGEQLIERARETITPDAAGKPVRFQHVPAEAGAKSYVIDVPAQPNETETANNRIEKLVLVTESKQLKVLYIDGYPRYEFRYVKALLERETDAVPGNRSVLLHSMLLDASPGYTDLDKSAIRDFPSRNELFKYDVVILGDVLPSQLPRANQIYGDLAEFVKSRGGGLLIMAGEHANPQKLFDTALADLLPIVPSEAALRNGGPKTTSENNPITETYLPKLTAMGRSHPLMRFSSDDADNTRIWNSLSPFHWSASGYRKKAAAEVLAVHPEKLAEGEASANHPIVLQQFVGAGRVVFFGFDETWRWRLRNNEPRFNQFWTQGVRALARTKVVRTELRTDKQTAYRKNEPIRITVRFPDDAPAPADNVSVRVSVSRKPLKLSSGQAEIGDTETTMVQLTKREGTRATYETLLTRTPEGEYTFHLAEPKSAPRDGQVPMNPPRAEAKVLPPPGERDRLEMNRSDLTKAAAESRGKFYTLATAHTLIDDLPEVFRYPLNQPTSPISIWDHAAMFGLVLALFAVEWWIRRRDRLV